MQSSIAAFAGRVRLQSVTRVSQILMQYPGWAGVLARRPTLQLAVGRVRDKHLFLPTNHEALTLCPRGFVLVRG